MKAKLITALAAVLMVSTFAPAIMVVNYSVEGSDAGWTGTFTVAGADALISSVESVTINSQVGEQVLTITPTVFDTGGYAVLWLDSTGTNAFMLIAPDVYDIVDSGGTWGDLIGNTYDLVIDSKNITTLFSNNQDIIHTSTGTVTFSTVPEPATMALLGLGGLLIRRRRA